MKNNNHGYNIILEYIKDLSIETPSASALTFVRENLSNYIMDIDISSSVLKNKALEVTTKLSLQDKKDNLEKAHFEIKYSSLDMALMYVWWVMSFFLPIFDTCLKTVLTCSQRPVAAKS